jgi:hypothetical protein
MLSSTPSRLRTPFAELAAGAPSLLGRVGDRETILRGKRFQLPNGLDSTIVSVNISSLA